MSLKISDLQAYRYAIDVVDGKQIASKKVVKACERFLHDLERSKDSAYPWRFDIELALRPINFIEKFLKPTKGDYGKMKLMNWQHFIESNAYGWVSKDSGLRRFREVLFLVGRGNGKSTLISGNATYMASKDYEQGADIFLLANSKDQAKIVFDECKTQIEVSPLLSRHFRPLRGTVFYDKTNSKIEPRASDSKRLDGLNPHGMVFDEVHGFRDYKLINVMKRAAKKRRQSLTWYISTMGDVLDGPLMDLYEFGSDILDKVIPDRIADRMFVYIAEIDEGDDPENVDCWIKANPALGHFLNLNETVADWETSKRSPAEKNDFINKQLNVFTDTGDMPYVEYEVRQRNNKSIDTAVLNGMSCYGGFDASLTEDFTAAALEFPLEDGSFFVLHHSWIPERKMDLDNEKIPYRELAKSGYLTIIPGEYIKQDVILMWFKEQMRQYNIVSVGYDPANASWLVQSLMALGIECNPVIQGWKTLNEPMKNIRETLLDAKFISNNDPMLMWYLSNVKLRNQPGDLDRENWVPTKRGKYRKIDGFMAWLDAHTEYMRKNPVIPNEREPDIRFYSL